MKMPLHLENSDNSLAKAVCVSISSGPWIMQKLSVQYLKGHWLVTGCCLFMQTVWLTAVIGEALQGLHMYTESPSHHSSLTVG